MNRRHEPDACSKERCTSCEAVRAERRLAAAFASMDRALSDSLSSSKRLVDVTQPVSLSAVKAALKR